MDSNGLSTKSERGPFILISSNSEKRREGSDRKLDLITRIAAPVMPSGLSSHYL